MESTTSMEPLIINFVPTGMVPTKEITSFVPISSQEIIEEVHNAAELGITMVHLHARDEDGEPTYKREFYEKILSGIRAHCAELVVCLSLSGRNFNDLSKRTEALSLKPDMGSLTLSSLNFPTQASVNSPSMIKGLCDEMLKHGSKPELEIFDLGMLNYANYLIDKGTLKAPFYFNIIVGNIAGLQLDLQHISSAIHDLPEHSYWSLGGIGRTQLKANTIAMAVGGGVRVGIEDNIYFDATRQIKAKNIDLIKRIHRIAAELERPIMKSKTFGDLGFYNKFRNA